MQLAGNQIVNAPSSRIWQLLMNPDLLAKVVPGISSLEKLSENLFKSVIIIKMGPINGTFTGHLNLDDLVEEKSFLLKAQQNSKIGNANAEIKIDLTPKNENQTEVNFDGDVRMSGLLASMGQRVIGGVANTLTKQFFNNLERELAVPTNV
ncbi:MAG: carbon monoxide dehydrogenase [Chitinophagaceae bacterium]|nr:MAG: carbon monoxide dehydrogenase [Chitinophagaceae bacterium]